MVPTSHQVEAGLLWIDQHYDGEPGTVDPVENALVRYFKLTGSISAEADARASLSAWYAA